MEDKDKAAHFTNSLGYTDVFSKRQIWRDIAAEFNGEFKVYHSSSKSLEKHVTRIPYDKWVIEISASDTRPLKFKMNFDLSNDFEIYISWEDLIDKIKKKFGKVEPQTGNAEFDKRYFINTKQTDIFYKVFTPDIQATMLKYNVYLFSFVKDEKTNSAEMLSVIQRQIGQKEMIVEIIGMFMKVIDNLKSAHIVY